MTGVWLLVKNKIIKNNDHILRILDVKDDKYLVIDCRKLRMAKWISKDDVKDYIVINEDEFLEITNVSICSYDDLSNEDKKITNDRFGSISIIVNSVGDYKVRSRLLKLCSNNYKVSIETIRSRLWSYLVFQNICILAPVKNEVKELSNDEKNFRYGLNKYYYNGLELSLMETYRRILKDKYCDNEGKLLDEVPSYKKFYYYYTKTNSKTNELISRKGKGKFLRDFRPLLGNGVRDFCKNIGYGMFDSTVCDIYLINDYGELIGRPILTACVDGYSSMCLGYSLGLVGGVKSLKKLVFNIVEDKKLWCSKIGVNIEDNDWINKNLLPHKFITDRGRDYLSENFSQLTDLGIEIINLPPYRPELKGIVEKFFDLVQSTFKKILADKGVIFSDFQERGSVDYRKKASLTLEEFEKVIVNCIVYYNKGTVVNIPYELVDKCKAVPYEIFNYMLKNNSNTFIKVDKNLVEKTLLSRGEGQFKRNGLIVNGIRYKNINYMDEYLEGKKVLVAYDSNDVSKVYLIENGNYIEFELIEKELKDKTLEEVELIKVEKNKVINEAKIIKCKSSIEIQKVLDELVESFDKDIEVDIKNVRTNRKNEIKKGAL